MTGTKVFGVFHQNGFALSGQFDRKTRRTVRLVEKHPERFTVQGIGKIGGDAPKQVRAHETTRHGELIGPVGAFPADPVDRRFQESKIFTGNYDQSLGGLGRMNSCRGGVKHRPLAAVFFQEPVDQRRFGRLPLQN